MPLFIALVCCCSATQARDIETVTTLHDTIPIYGTQSDDPKLRFKPGLTDETLIVPAGQTLTLNRFESTLDVLVLGTLQLQPGAELACRTLTVLGTEARLEMQGHCTLTIRDLPIDTSIDPAQYGHGLLVIDGSLFIQTDDWRLTSQQLAQEINAGDTTIELVGEARGWRAGDRLVLPDTRQPKSGSELSEQTEVVTIAEAYLGTITLTEPVQYDHLGWRDSNGDVQLLPHVGCLSQPVVIRSENPDGVRGHVFITINADQDVRGVSVVEMGRTRAADKLDSTTVNPQGKVTRLGTNQIGRYAWHHHHLLGRPPAPIASDIEIGSQMTARNWQFRLEHVSIDGSPKWGIAVHGSHFGIVNDCLAYNCAGSGIVTEDPYAYGNKITNNMVVARQPGSGQRITERAGRNKPSGDHWHDRGGLGLESAMNEITGNHVYCCKESFGMAGFGTTSLYYPSAMGVCACDIRGPYSVSLSAKSSHDEKIYPLVFDTSGNLAWGGWRGWETWTANSAPDDQVVTVTTSYSDQHPIDNDLQVRHFFPGMTLVHCRVPTDFQDQRETALYGWKILGDWNFSVWHDDPGNDQAKFLYGLDWKGAYRFGITIDDCEVRGYDAAYRGEKDSDYVRFNNCTFECPIIMYHERGHFRPFRRSVEYAWNECEFLPVHGRLLALSGKYPKYDLNLWISPGRTSRRTAPAVTYLFNPWRDGRVLNAYHYEQHIDWEHDKGPPPPGRPYGDWPEGVWTQRQLAEHGQPIFGAVVPDTASREPEFGVFYVNIRDPLESSSRSCADELQQLREENARLQEALERLQAEP